MDIQTISTKSLREDFSQVLTAMEKNKKLILIYRSKPIAAKTERQKAGTNKILLAIDEERKGIGSIK